MSSRKLRTIENLILITFPVVLFAGCAGSDVKPVLSEPTTMTISEKETEDQSVSYSEPELPTISHIEPASELEQSVSSEEKTDMQPLEHRDDSGNAIVVTMPEKKIFFFDTNIHALSEYQHEDLKNHADYLIANPGIVLVINGHADVRGTENYNQTLSEKRAAETYNLLVEFGVPEDQLLKKGFGELVPMNEENNWDENRRVELQYTDPVMLSSM